MPVPEWDDEDYTWDDSRVTWSGRRITDWAVVTELEDIWVRVIKTPGN